MGSYVPSTQEQRQEMLQAIGLKDFRDLYRDVPESMYLDHPLDLPEGQSELEVSRALSAMARKNRVYDAILRGAGAYDHYIPSIVKYIPAKEEFLTAYTKNGSGHSECIITNNKDAASAFQAQVDAACVYVNAPTSFTDGAQFGLGAEIGISTQKLGPRGPMALEEMTTYKWLIDGNGQIRP